LSLRSYGPPLAQGGSGHGLHLHSVFDFPSTRVVQIDAQEEIKAPDNATAWQPSVFDCGRQPLLLSGYFQHVECVFGRLFFEFFSVTFGRYVRPVADQLLHHFVFLERDACSSSMRALRSSTDNPFVISVHVRRGDNVRVHNGPSITRALHPSYIDRAVRRVLDRMALDEAKESAIALLFSDSPGDLDWCAAHVQLPIPSVVPVYDVDLLGARTFLKGYNITSCGHGVAPRWCDIGKLLPSQLEGRSPRLGGDGSDMCLMSACDGWVLSPSTYGWWGAWLGAQRLSQHLHTVVLPLPWFNPSHATTGRLDASGLIWDHRWEWLELDSSDDVHFSSGGDAAIEFRQPDGGWRWNMSTGSFVFRFYVWSAVGGGVNCFINDVLVGGPYPPFQDIKLEFTPQSLSPGMKARFHWRSTCRLFCFSYVLSGDLT
jgi:hypothetical protein